MSKIGEMFKEKKNQKNHKNTLKRIKSAEKIPIIALIWPAITPQRPSKSLFSAPIRTGL